MTSQANVVNENSGVPGGGVPGIFFKFDIEPILLTITQSRGSLLALLMRIVNVVSGIMVGGGWLYQLWGWAEENFLAKRRRRAGYEKGMIHGGKDESVCKIWRPGSDLSIHACADICLHHASSQCQ